MSPNLLDHLIELAWNQPWDFATSVAAVFGVLFLVVQIRYTKSQLTLEATLNLLHEYRIELLNDRITFLTKIAPELRKMLARNPKLGFRDLPGRMKETTIRISHFHDELGLLVGRGLVDADTILSFIGGSAIHYFRELRPLIENERKAREAERPQSPGKNISRT